MEYDVFFDEVWGSISSNIVSEEFMRKNRDIMESLTYDLYRTHQYSNIDINLIKKITESFCFHLIKQRNGN
jgi:hypothetical protein